MDYIHESKIFNERASVSERVSWIFLTSEYNPYKRGTRVIIYLLYAPYYLYFWGQNCKKNLGSGSEFHWTHLNLILMSVHSRWKSGLRICIGNSNSSNIIFILQSDWLRWRLPVNIFSSMSIIKQSDWLMKRMIQSDWPICIWAVKILEISSPLSYDIKQYVYNKIMYFITRVSHIFTAEQWKYGCYANCVLPMHFIQQ